MATLDDIAWELDGSVTGGSVLLADPSEGLWRVEEIHGEPLPVWELVCDHMTGAELTDLETTFDGARGGGGTTTYTPPGGSSTTVEFLDDELAVTWVRHDTYAVRVRVRAVL